MPFGRTGSGTGAIVKGRAGGGKGDDLRARGNNGMGTWGRGCMGEKPFDTETRGPGDADKKSCTGASAYRGIGEKACLKLMFLNKTWNS